MNSKLEYYHRMKPQTRLWIDTLPRGEYTIKELMEHAKTHRSVIAICFQKLGVRCTYAPTSKKTYQQKVIYFWEGIDYYLKSPMTADNEPIY